jgi:hypothetical protein
MSTELGIKGDLSAGCVHPAETTLPMRTIWRVK